MSVVHVSEEIDGGKKRKGGKKGKGGKEEKERNIKERWIKGMEEVRN